LKQDHLTPEGFCEIRWNDYGDAPRTKQDDGPRHVRLSPPPLATFADNDRIVADISMTRRRKGLGRCKRRRASAYRAVLVSPCERANSGQKSLEHGCVAPSWCSHPIDSSRLIGCHRCVGSGRCSTWIYGACTSGHRWLRFIPKDPATAERHKDAAAAFLHVDAMRRG
jgi:hypothetical protein